MTDLQKSLDLQNSCHLAKKKRWKVTTIQKILLKVKLKKCERKVKQ